MAVYRGPEQRRRTSVAIAIAALILGLLLGMAIGRGTAASVDDQIAEGRSGGRDLVSSLRVLPLEYEQASAGSSETGLIEDTVKRAAGKLPGALENAPWLDDRQRRAATEAVRAIEAAARSRVAPARFEATIARSTATLQAVFGLPASAGG